MRFLTPKQLRGPSALTVADIPIQVRKTVDNIQGLMFSLANKTRAMMVDIITSRKKRMGSANRLEDAIQVENDPNNKTVGIGNLQLLETQAPYWYLINYGGMVAPKAQVVGGWFQYDSWTVPVPAQAGTGAGRGKFIQQRNTHLMIVRNPIAGINYIQKANAFLIRALKTELSKVTPNKTV